MAALRDRAGGCPGHGAQVGLFEEVGWFGHSNGNTGATQSPEHGGSCEDQVQLGGRNGWVTWPNTHHHPVSAEAGCSGRVPPPQPFGGCGSQLGTAPLCTQKGHGLLEQSKGFPPTAEEVLAV